MTYQCTSRPNIVIEKSELIITDYFLDALYLISKGMYFGVLKTECKALLTKLMLLHH